MKHLKPKEIPIWPIRIFLFLFTVLIDQYTKIIMSQAPLGIPREVTPWLSFTYLQNTGATWGILKDSNTLFIFLSIFVLGILIYYYDSFKSRIEKLSYTLLLTGVVGNLIDRIIRGHVVDFIDLGWWPVFNVADAAITSGIAIYIIAQFHKKRLRKA